MEPHKSSMQNLWFVGALLATFASFISNLGLNLQKLLHLRNQGKSAEIRESYHKFPLWWIGVSLISLGAIADFAALTFAPQSLVAPLGSLTLVSNIILSPIILKEVVTTRDIIATLTIVCGCIVSVTFASHDDVIYSLNELFNFFLRWPFLIYAGLVTAFMIFLYIMVKHYESIENDPVRYTSRDEGWHRLSYPALSGTIGAQSVLFAKCTVEMIVNAFENRGLFLERWQGYLIFFALVFCIVCQVKWLNDGLLRFDASFEVPVFQAFWVVGSVGSGLIFYNEYKGMNTLQKCFFALGVIVTVAGVIMLSRGRRLYRPDRRGSTSAGGHGGTSAGQTDSEEEEADSLDSQTRICAPPDSDEDDEFDDASDHDRPFHRRGAGGSSSGSGGLNHHRTVLPAASASAGFAGSSSAGTSAGTGSGAGVGAARPRGRAHGPRGYGWVAGHPGEQAEDAWSEEEETGAGETNDALAAGVSSVLATGASSDGGSEDAAGTTTTASAAA